MTEALIVAAIGAVFNAGVMWGTMRALLWRIENAEESVERAHARIDQHLRKATRT